MDDKNTYPTNEATGEVTATIGGVVFKLRATLSRLADFQARLNVPGIGQLQMLVLSQDMRALNAGMRALLTSGNEKDLDDLLAIKHATELLGAIMTALTAGLPKREDVEGDTAGNGVAAATTH